jgi:hypothetical protein
VSTLRGRLRCSRGSRDKPVARGIRAPGQCFAAEALGGKPAIRITWVNDATNAVGFRIERKRDAGPFAQIGTTAAGSTAFVDCPVDPGVVYTYRVRAFNQDTLSEYSAEVRVSASAEVVAGAKALEAATGAARPRLKAPKPTTPLRASGTSAAPSPPGPPLAPVAGYQRTPASTTAMASSPPQGGLAPPLVQTPNPVPPAINAPPPEPARWVVTLPLRAVDVGGGRMTESGRSGLLPLPNGNGVVRASATYRGGTSGEGGQSGIIFALAGESGNSPDNFRNLFLNTSRLIIQFWSASSQGVNLAVNGLIVPVADGSCVDIEVQLDDLGDCSRYTVTASIDGRRLFEPQSGIAPYTNGSRQPKYISGYGYDNGGHVQSREFTFLGCK